MKKSIFSAYISGFILLNVFPAVSHAQQADACAQGYVWREAVPGDHVCVTPSSREAARLDNQDYRHVVKTHTPPGFRCIDGYTLRLATPTDRSCVPPHRSEQVAAENRDSSLHLARSTPQVSMRMPMPTATPAARPTESTIRCPLQSVTVDITNRLPDPWRSTPQGGRLMGGSVSNIGGTMSLICTYQVNDGSVSVVRPIPQGYRDCDAASGGVFNCH